MLPIRAKRCPLYQKKTEMYREKCEFYQLLSARLRKNPKHRFPARPEIHSISKRKISFHFLLQAEKLFEFPR